MKLRRQVDENIVQITTDENRWYREETALNEKEISYNYYPSVTWILEYAPVEVFLRKWWANLPDYDTAKQIYRERGNAGKRVHAAIELLLKGKEVTIYDIMPDLF